MKDTELQWCATCRRATVHRLDNNGWWRCTEHPDRPQRETLDIGRIEPERPRHKSKHWKEEDEWRP